ncbi:hypothetical protein BH09BAC1_BH09BAC1_21960 [soil metagenome]
MKDNTETTEVATPKIAKTRQELRDIADKMLKEGISEDEVRQYLLSEGLDLNSVYAMLGSLTQGAGFYKPIDGIVDSRTGNRNSDSASRDIMIGGLWFVGGILVTAISYSSGGRTYVVAWGAILFGGIQMVRGMMNSGNS